MYMYISTVDYDENRLRTQVTETVIRRLIFVFVLVLNKNSKPFELALKRNLTSFN